MSSDVSEFAVYTDFDNELFRLPNQDEGLTMGWPFNGNDYFY